MSSLPQEKKEALDIIVAKIKILDKKDPNSREKLIEENMLYDDFYSELMELDREGYDIGNYVGFAIRNSGH